MNKRTIMLMATALALLSVRGQVSFVGTMEHPVKVKEVTPDKSETGLDKIFVVYDTDGVGMTFPSTTGERAKWYTYDADTWGSPVEISNVGWDGSMTKLSQVIPNIGYIIEEGTDRKYYWVVNYADYPLELNDMFINNELPCNLLTFNIDGQGDAIPYYSIHGKRQVLDRDIQLTYTNATFVWDDLIRGHWEDSDVVESFAALDQGVEIVPPLCDTEFTLSGDRFLKEWGIEEAIKGVHFSTKAVGCVSTAVLLDSQGEILKDDQGKEVKLDGDLTEGSAPVRILFSGYSTESAVYRRWEIATDADFENVVLQFNQDELDYTFNDAVTYYVRYMVANDDGTCEAYGDTYSINVSESSLGKGAKGDIPNVFLPDGSNKWKVPNKSIVEFHCWIYNRWGNLVYEFTDPDGGWDGTYRGRQVDTGVFYYVVTAVGGDGQKHKKRGDINILRYHGSNTSGSGTTDGSGVGE